MEVVPMPFSPLHAYCALVTTLLAFTWGAGWWLAGRALEQWPED